MYCGEVCVVAITDHAVYLYIIYVKRRTAQEIIEVFI